MPAAQSQTAQVKPNAYPSPGPIGNTSGLVIPDTAPSLHGATAPAIKPVAQEKSWWQRWGSDVVHTGLDVVGLIPGVGEIADGANALIYLAEGDKVNTALSAAAMIPGAGMAATGVWEEGSSSGNRGRRQESRPRSGRSWITKSSQRG